MLISLDGYALHCRNLGVVAANRLVEKLAAYLAEINAWKQTPLRVADNQLAIVLPVEDAEQLAVAAQKSVERTSSHIHVLGAQSATCNICVAVCPLVRENESLEAFIDRSFATLAIVTETAERLRGTDPTRVTIMRVAEEVPPAPVAATASLQEEISGGNFHVTFQPIVSLRGDSSEHYEALPMHSSTQQSAAAWLESACGLTGSMELDQWYIAAACKKLAAHRSSRPQTRAILSIGAASIVDPDFIPWLAATLRSTGLPAESIVIQMSHRDVGSRLREAKLHVERLRGMGCQVSISAVHSASKPIADLAHLRPQFARIDEALSEALKDSDATDTLLKPLIEALHQEQIASIMPEVQNAGVLAVLWQLGVHFIRRLPATAGRGHAIRFHRAWPTPRALQSVATSTRSTFWKPRGSLLPRRPRSPR